MARLTQDNPDRNQQAVIAEALFQIVIDVLVIALQFGVMEQARLASNMETMRELVHTQRVQYEASKESAQLINEKYHDLRQYRTNELVLHCPKQDIPGKNLPGAKKTCILFLSLFS